jgi:hypothetical protein
MEYTDDFKSRVLSVVGDASIRESILNGKMDVGDYLKEYAFKGIDSKIILECIYLNNLEYLRKLARRQEIIKALYQEWFECYVMKAGPTLQQKAIDEEIKKRKK